MMNFCLSFGLRCAVKCHQLWDQACIGTVYMQSGPSVHVLELWGRASTSMYSLEPWDQACKCVESEKSRDNCRLRNVRYFTALWARQVPMAL